MATIKSYSDLQQSKKLAEILPLESADMSYLSDESLFPKVNYNGMVFFNSEEEKPSTIIPCWSLAALLNALPRIKNLKPVLDLEFNYVQYETYDIDLNATGDNPVDACYELILKLNELNLL